MVEEGLVVVVVVDVGFINLGMGRGEALWKCQAILLGQFLGQQHLTGMAMGTKAGSLAGSLALRLHPHCVKNGSGKINDDVIPGSAEISSYLLSSDSDLRLQGWVSWRPMINFCR